MHVLYAMFVVIYTGGDSIIDWLID